MIGFTYRFFMSMTNSLARMQLDEILNLYFQALPEGNVLEIGSGKYPLYKDKVKAVTYQTLDIRKEVEPDICADIHNMPIEDETYDIVFATEVLEHCHTPQKAIGEIHRILKKGGVCILSTRFMFKIHGSPYDYFRFTDQGLLHLFKGFKEKEIKSHGNVFTAFFDNFYKKSFPLRIFFLVNSPLKYIFFWKSKVCPSGYVVYAVK